MRILLFIALALTLSQCRLDSQKIKGLPNIVCTTSIAGDAVRNVVGDKGNVTILMGPGVDPHEYKQKPSDTKLLEEADIIVYHGLHLEGKMSNTFEKIKANKRPIIIDLSEAISESDLIHLSEDSHDHGHGHGHDSHDPHIWNDVKLWIKCVNYIGSRMSSIKEEHKDIYHENAENYSKELLELDHELTELYGSIPDSSRVLVTAHDAFAYLGRSKNMRVESLQGFSTAAEFGIKDVTNLANYIISNNIKSIYLESSVPNRNLESVINHCKEEGHSVTIGGKLYSDALGDKKSGAETYPSMMRANANTIVNGLK